MDGADAAHPGARARFAMHEGKFYKAYPTEISPETEIWHGYPVHQTLVKTQIPTRILRNFVKAGKLPKPDYKRLMGSA